MEEEGLIVNGGKLPPKPHIVLKRPQSTVSGLCDDQDVLVEDLNRPLPFDSIRKVVVDFKRKYKCDDIVLPEQKDFRKKWAVLTNAIPNMTGKNLSPEDAIAIIDCTVMGGCEHGALIDKSGIYMINENIELNGWLDWNDFIAKADIARSDSFEFVICSQPNVGLDISGCDLNMRKAIELFWAILQKASYGEANESQVHLLSRWEQTKDTGCSCIAVIVVLALLGWGGYALYNHFPNIKGWFSSLFSGKEEKPIPMDIDAEVKTGTLMIDWIKIRDKLTDLQNEECFKEIKGKMVIVSGEVREIGKTTIGNHTFVSLKADKKSTFKNVNIQFNVPDSLASAVIKWQKGESHVMRGCVDALGDLVDDVVCEKAEILDENEEFRVWVKNHSSSDSSESTVAPSSTSKETSGDSTLKKRKEQLGKLYNAAQLFMTDEQKAKVQELKDKAKDTVEELEKSMTDEDREKMKTLKEGASTTLELYREFKPKKTDDD